MTKEQKGYISYLIRMWQVESKGELIWRASLESWQTGKRHGFASPEALLAFLRKETETPPNRMGTRVNDPRRQNVYQTFFMCPSCCSRYWRLCFR